jgi:plastocyanin
MFAGVVARSTAILALVAGTMVPAITTGGVASAQATGPTIMVGSGETGYAVNLFGPDEVTVEVGTTLNFESGWLEPHTVTFPGEDEVPPPSDPTAAVPTHPGEVVDYDGTEYVSSGFIFPSTPFQITMAAEGSFPFVCIIHPGMAGTVEVVAEGEPVSEQADLDAAAEEIFADELVELKAEAAELSAKPVQQVQNADGTTTWRVNTVGGLVEPSDVMQFFPPSMNIKEGDTVVWESTVPTPHTVSFLGGENPDELFGEVTDPFEEEKIFLPVEPPAGGYNGVGYINSGVIGVGWPSGQTFEVKFTEDGSFSYACILHIDQGMGGVVNVSARTQATPTATATATPTRTSTPAPPKTGSAGMDAEAPYVGLMLLGFGTTVLVGVRVATGRWR